MRKNIYYCIFIVCSSLSYDVIGSFNKHIKQTHFFDSKAAYTDEVYNAQTGVKSVVYTKKSPESLVGQRKTVFPIKTDVKAYENTLQRVCESGHLLFMHDQSKTGSNCRVEYRELRDYPKLVLGIVKEKNGSIKTMYPILQYISFDELKAKKNGSLVYLASVRDTDGKFVKIEVAPADIEKLSHQGKFLAYKELSSTKEQRYLVDIAGFFPQIFYGTKETYGSILVETDWLKK